AFGTGLIFDTMRQAGMDLKEVYVSGGPAKSELWMQIHADVTNVPISMTEVPDAPLLGSPILASVAAGKYSSIQEAAENMVRVTKRIEPDPKAHEEYRFYYERYVRTYEAMKDLVHEVARHEASRGAQA